LRKQRKEDESLDFAHPLVLPLFLSACGASLSAAPVVLFAASTWLLGILFFPLPLREREREREREIERANERKGSPMCTHTRGSKDFGSK